MPGAGAGSLLVNPSGCLGLRVQGLGSWAQQDMRAAGGLTNLWHHSGNTPLRRSVSLSAGEPGSRTAAAKKKKKEKNCTLVPSAPAAGGVKCCWTCCHRLVAAQELQRVRPAAWSETMRPSAVRSWGACRFRRTDPASCRHSRQAGRCPLTCIGANGLTEGHLPERKLQRNP